MFRSLSRVAADPSGSVTVQEPANQIHGRLHALFSSRSISPGPEDGLPQVIVEPIVNGQTKGSTSVPEPVSERDAIKVLIITWNMGDALVSFVLERC
jgi:hypothetical protein